MLERGIEKKLTDGVRKLGGRAFKWVSPGNVGVPDRIVILPQGRIIFIELKNDTGIVRPTQKNQINLLKSLGCDVRVVKGLAEVNKFLEEIGGQT